MNATAVRQAIGIVRVSQVNGREGPSFASPSEQRERIAAQCEREGLQLIKTVDELDVSGGTPLDKRTGLRTVVESIEAGEAGVVMVAYFDRLFRSLTVQTEVLERVEAAGGQVLAVDVGQVTNGSAGQWLSGTMLGAVSEYQRRTAKERSAEAQQRAISRGVLPYPNVPPGYVRGADGVLVRDPELAPVVAEGFRMRADGATVEAVRMYLIANGIQRSYHGTTSLLESRVVLGEIHFGDYEPNLTAHEAIVDRDVWKQVQAASVPRGRKPKSERLLARLGVLRCATCDARMVVGSANRRQYPTYRCPPTGDCTQRVSISAELVEQVVVDRVRAALADVEGRASVEDNARNAATALERAQQDLDAALRAFAGLEDETAARDRLIELREIRDEAKERVNHLGSQTAVVSLNAAADWERLSLDARRSLIRAVVARVLVAPGRGIERVTVELNQ